MSRTPELNPDESSPDDSNPFSVYINSLLSLDALSATSTPEVLGLHEAMSLRDVSVYYDDRLAIGGVSLDIRKKEITAIMGPSKSGKTSLLNAMNRNIENMLGGRVTGEVFVAGHGDIYSDELRRMRIKHLIGMASKNPIFSPATVYNTVASVPRSLDFDEDQVDEMVELALARTGLLENIDNILSKRVAALSEEQRRRLVIAKAIATDPDILLIDQPTAGLDETAGLRIEELILNLRGKYTIVLAAGSLSQTARLGDYTAFVSGS